MVICNEFIWLHIPKTAGDATLAMFKLLDHEWAVIDPNTDPEKHGTLADAHARVRESAQLPVIANLRRLPELVLSYFFHMQRHRADEVFANGRSFGQMDFGEFSRYLVEHPETHSYDNVIEGFVGDRAVDHWIRVSDLSASFVEIIGSIISLDETVCEQLLSVRANVGTYDKRSITDWYSREDIEALYRNAPRWREAELKTYGDLMVDVIDWGTQD